MLERLFGLIIAFFGTIWMIIIGGIMAIPDIFRYRRLSRM